MGKFKVGDKVRILDGSKIKNYAGEWVKSMGLFVGKVETIYGIKEFSNGVVGYKLRNTCGFTFDERGLKPCINETIVIYRKGNEVIALDKATGKKAIAKCSPEDTFDFNIGAKLAFDRLMNGNKESITVEDMRKKLNGYCKSRGCEGCELFHSCRCGCGVTFISKTPTGDYEMSNKEIKAAFNIVFGTGVREVKRRAKKGEYVKIIDAECSFGNYKTGDILKIIDDSGFYIKYGCGCGEWLYDNEYVVLDGYKPDEPKEPHKFKVGDIVKGNSESNDRYLITNSNMTRGKVIYVSENGDIKIKVLSHKTMPYEVGEEYFGLKSKYFDLVEEPPKFYNGKIIFTKGDDTFKTGHVYEVKDGRVIAPAYGSLPLIEPFKDIEDVKDYFTGNLDENRKRKFGWSPYTLELMEVED